MTIWNRIDVGEGQPLLLLHGGGGSSRQWLPVIDGLRPGRRVVAFDLPGFGQTPAASGATMTPDWAVEQLVSQLELVGIRTPVDIAGHSMGGWLALEAAKRGVAKSVVAIGPAGLWARGMPIVTRALFGTAMKTAWLAGTPAVGILRRTRGRGAVLSLVVRHPDRMPDDEAVEFFQDLHRSVPALREMVHQATALRFEEGQDIEVPVTVAFGTHDRFVPARTSQRREELPSHTRWVTLPDCGHLPMWDDPDLIVRTILDGTRDGLVLAVNREPADEPIGAEHVH